MGTSSQPSLKRTKISINAEDKLLIEELLKDCCQQLVEEGLLLTRKGTIDDMENTVIYTLASVDRVLRPALIKQRDKFISMDQQNMISTHMIVQETAKVMPKVRVWRLKKVWGEMRLTNTHIS